MTGRRFVIHGDVQGVGFRGFVRRHAERLGLPGWVRNRPDGSVEAEAFGGPEVLDQLGLLLAEGPAASIVTKVETTEILDENVVVSGFRVVR